MSHIATKLAAIEASGASDAAKRAAALEVSAGACWRRAAHYAGEAARVERGGTSRAAILHGKQMEALIARALR